MRLLSKKSFEASGILLSDLCWRNTDNAGHVGNSIVVGEAIETSSGLL